MGLCKLDLENRLLGPLGLGSLVDLGTRSGYNPFEMLGDQPAGAWTFWAIRLFGLTLVVPFIEEAFLRGFLMRYFVDRDWWDVPFGQGQQRRNRGSGRSAGPFCIGRNGSGGRSGFRMVTLAYGKNPKFLGLCCRALRDKRDCWAFGSGIAASGISCKNRKLSSDFDLLWILIRHI